MEIKTNSEEFKLKRKTNSENKHICQFCGKIYTLKKCLLNHEIIHKENKLKNTKVKLKKDITQCSWCSYKSDRNSSIIK